ncbi:MAG TPA: hypothetical protein VKV27_15445 [Solirubrobacteraceae bacterium]|nr:hypothetical protein [Solirubrobacteraceae bacterium]
MSPTRTQAYRRVIKTLSDVGPAKLHPAEQDRIRAAADSLIFCADLFADDDAGTALEDCERLCRALVDSGRWERASAAELAADVRACGPELTIELEAA